MIKKPSYIIIYTSILLATAFSCSNFLDELPDNRTEIDSKEKIGELLVNAYPEASYFWVAESMSDNSTDIGLANTSNLDINTTKYYWNDIVGDGQDTPTFYWNACYAAIAQANQALKSAEELGGGKDMDPYIGEALVARAYAHFMLVTLWGKSYNPNTSSSNLGVPIVTEPETVVLKKYQRASVEQVYMQIEKDLLKGMSLLNNNYKKPKFHFTVHAAYVFASRFYQFKGQWNKVINYADKALGETPENLIRDWLYYRTITASEVRIRHQSSEENTNLLIVGAKSLYARHYEDGRYGISSQLRNKIFSSRVHPLNKRWGYVIRVFSSTRYFVPKYREYFKYTNLSASTGLAYCMNVLFTYDEALLNRAEAYVMLNNYEAAVKDLNTFLSKKTRNYDASSDILTYDDFVDFYQPQVKADDFLPFYQISNKQLPFIKCILDNRQREFIHEGIRWLDNKRMNMKIIHEDFDENSFALSKDDLRRELEIPVEAVKLGLKQNPR
ncbi:MAG: RagB/SusD family nutrient uptake outer membrane protein [Tenacibaculum sp.]